MTREERIKGVWSVAGVVVLVLVFTCSGLVSSANAATGANFIATGHDMDLHCSAATKEECEYLKIVVDKVRNGSTLPILALDQGTELPTALVNAGYNAGEVVTVNPVNATALNATAFIDGSGHPLYSAIITASDETCGGCDNTLEGEANINARAKDFAAYFNAGGGILALAGAEHNATYYNFVPLTVAAIAVAPPFTVTATGTALGITEAMANCCATHNSFTTPPEPVVILESDGAGNAETIAALQATIGEKGFGGKTHTALATSLSAAGKSGEQITVPAGTAVTARAVLGGTNASTATGTVEYRVYSDNACTRLVTAAGSASVNGGAVGASQPETLGAGTYYWQTSYSGDGSNEASASVCGSEVLTVTPAPPAKKEVLPFKQLSAPVLGKTVNVEVVSGVVFVKLPPGAHLSMVGSPFSAFASLSKGAGFIPLTEARQIPVGSTLDTTAGVARLTTATAKVGKVQFGDFGAGIFTILQDRKQRGLTNLNIVNTHPARQVCATLGKKASTAAKHLSSKVLGRLSGNAHGKFTTRGQYSAATVRGTIWAVSNRCDGTLTQVTRGVVTVRDFLHRKTITLFAGQRYLAKAR